MSPLFELIKSLVPHIPSQQQRDEEYLSHSVDLYDVERRLAEIDHRGAHVPSQTFPLGGALH